MAYMQANLNKLIAYDSHQQLTNTAQLLRLDIVKLSVLFSKVTNPLIQNSPDEF